MRESRFKIKGMTCPHCVAAVENSVRGLEGVITVQADLTKSNAFVQYDEGKVKKKDIENAITEEGYEVMGVEN